MAWTEDSLMDLWNSLFSSEVCSKVKDADSFIIGPLMLVERVSAALKELGLNYGVCLEQLKDCQKKCLNSEDQVSSLRDKLNETQKPCENCRVLAKDLSEARKRASDAEHQVTQIAKILIVRSSNNDNNDENISPGKSPKRKRNCVRSKEVEGGGGSPPAQCVGGSWEEAVVERSPGRVSPNSDSGSRVASQSTPVNGKNKKWSRSAVNIQESWSYKNSRRNLSSDFEDVGLSPTDKERKKDRVLQKCTENRERSGDGLTRSALEQQRIKEDVRSGDGDSSSQATVVGSMLGSSETTRTGVVRKVETRVYKADTECHRTPTDRRNKRLTLIRRPSTRNPDNSYDLILERKKPKKRMKQLTLEMKVTTKEELNNTVESEDDIVSPSPTRGAAAGVDAKSAEDEDEEEFKPGVTSTQLSLVPNWGVAEPTPSSHHNSHPLDDNSFDLPAVDKKRKTPSPNYMYQGKTIRGKARTNLPGWDCEDCQKFYQLAGKNLSPRKVKAKMNYCSKHRSKYKQTRPPTPPGFWDIDIPDTPE